MRLICPPGGNGGNESQWRQHWHSLTSRWLFAWLTDATMPEVSTRSQTHAAFSRRGGGPLRTKEFHETITLSRMLTGTPFASLSHSKWEYCSKSNSHLMMLITVDITDCIQTQRLCTSKRSTKHSQYSLTRQKETVKVQVQAVVLCDFYLFFLDCFLLFIVALTAESFPAYHQTRPKIVQFQHRRHAGKSQWRIVLHTVCHLQTLAM